MRMRAATRACLISTAAAVLSLTVAAAAQIKAPSTVGLQALVTLLNPLQPPATPAAATLRQAGNDAAILLRPVLQTLDRDVMAELELSMLLVDDKSGVGIRAADTVAAGLTPKSQRVHRLLADAWRKRASLVPGEDMAAAYAAAERNALAVIAFPDVEIDDLSMLAAIQQLIPGREAEAFASFNAAVQRGAATGKADFIRALDYRGLIQAGFAAGRESDLAATLEALDKGGYIGAMDALHIAEGFKGAAAYARAIPFYRRALPGLTGPANRFWRVVDAWGWAESLERMGDPAGAYTKYEACIVEADGHKDTQDHADDAKRKVAELKAKLGRKAA